MQLRDNICHITDLMATFIDVARATYPKTYHGGNDIIPLEGTSLMPAVDHPDAKLHEYRDEVTDKWELYFIPGDRTERHDLSLEKPEQLKALVSKWEEWANTHHVYPKGRGGRDTRLKE